jgi:hypothetical protein|tara:strand:+ start:291 stop:665 length:375 start_codon:yes stop_codon:yes gene_type:complete
MAMKLIKKSADYKIFVRGDDRYAVQDSNGRSVNGEEKVRILVEEELIKVAVPSAPAAVADEVEAVAEEAAEEPAAEAAEQVESEESAPDAPAVEETPAEDEASAVEEAPAEEAPAADEAEEEAK